MRQMMHTKRGQYYEMIMVFAGIILLVTVFISVISQRSPVPTDANLATKTIMLTEKTFDTLIFYFQTSATDVSQNVHLLSASGLKNCPKISSDNLNNPLAGEFIITPDCLYPTIITDYTQRFSDELDKRFTRLHYSGFDQGYPQSFLLKDPATQFVSGQFLVTINQNSASPSITVISRRPLTIHASAPTKDNSDTQWTFDAQRDLITNTQLPTDDANLLKLTQSLSTIKVDALIPVLQLVNMHNQEPKTPITDAEKQDVLTKIGVSINLDAQLNYLKPISLQTNPQNTYYFAYGVILQQNQIYVIFPNAQMATPIYNFS